MDTQTNNKIVSFIWSIADDCLRDVYVRGKYRDVILPMVVLRRLDVLLEPTKEAVREEVIFQQTELNQTILTPDGLMEAAGYVFYNTSRWTLKTLHASATNSAQILVSNFEEYLNGFSDNVQEIITRFNLRAQIKHMADKNVLVEVLEKFTSLDINLSPEPSIDSKGNTLPPLTNLGMGNVFEELIRKFNEENNEEAGEHFTPREVIDLMTHLVFDPVKETLPAIISIYDPACGSGGMLTESENYLTHDDGHFQYQGDILLYGKEINDETYAICKSDMMIKGQDPSRIRSESTLATDEFASERFNFMLSNPPYGKSWTSDEKFIKDEGKVIDERFLLPLLNFKGDGEIVEAVPRTSDGQLLFMLEMISKMKPVGNGMIGSRIASVHNGSALFTGDAGSGESNIRRYIIENDLLEAIIQLPNNLFYNTGITTYIWLLSNNKAAHRKGKVQLIDANKLFRKLRKNLGNKNSEFSPEQIALIAQQYLDFAAGSFADDRLNIKLFDNADFGYYKVTIERPKRLKAQMTDERLEALRWDKKLAPQMQWLFAQYGDACYQGLAVEEKTLFKQLEDAGLEVNKKQLAQLTSKALWEKGAALLANAKAVQAQVGTDEWMDYNAFVDKVEKALKTLALKLGASEKKNILDAVSWSDAAAAKVIKKKEKLTGEKLDNLLAELDCSMAQLPQYGYYQTDNAGEYLLYETDSDLRDSESVPLKENIYDYFMREVHPHVAEAWINLDTVKIGYEISFNKYFYRYTPLRSIEAVAKDILDLEKQSDGLIQQILNF